MIEFDCPECGEPMKAKDGQAGQRVRCDGCDAKVKVPKGRRRPPMPFFGVTEFSWPEYIIFASVILFVPCIGLIVAIVVYTFWRDDKPTKAYQLKQLTAVIGCIWALMFCILCGGGAIIGTRPGGRRVSLDPPENHAVLWKINE